MKIDKEDGSFFMSIEDYQHLFSMSYANLNTEGMHHDYFLRLNDNSSPNG